MSWKLLTGTRVAVFDEHGAEFVYRGSETTAAVEVERASSAALTVYRLGKARAHPIARVQALRPPARSSLSEVVTVTSGSGTTVGVDDRARIANLRITEGASSERVDGDDPAVVDAPLGRPADVAVTAVSREDDRVTHLYQGISLRRPLPFAVASAAAEDPSDELETTGVPTTTLSRFYYDTWIPYQYINAPDAGGPTCESGDGSDYWYGGDGVANQTDGDKFRTRVKTTWRWRTRERGISRTISPTTRHVQNDDGSFTYDSMRQAPYDGLEVQNNVNDGTEGKAYIAHSVGNPYCDSSNNIDYANIQTAYRLGGYDTVGEHDQMPHHKLYLFSKKSDGTVSWQTVFFDKLKSPFCLNPATAPVCPQIQYQYSR